MYKQHKFNISVKSFSKYINIIFIHLVPLGKLIWFVSIAYREGEWKLPKKQDLPKNQVEYVPLPQEITHLDMCHSFSEL